MVWTPSRTFTAERKDEMLKAYWRGHPIYYIGDIVGDWVKICFYDNASPITGTGACWASMDDITVEDDEK